MMLITNRVRVKFGELDEALLGLSEDVNILMSEMSSYSGMDMFDSQVSVDLDTNASDELEAIGNQIRTLREETSLYLEYLRTQAYIDPLTKVGSSAAYHEAVDELNQKIDQGVADFWVVVVDINRLKELNDTLGHECGDYYIQGTAQSLVQGFGASRVYRIGGDEFAVVVEGDDRTRVDECIGDVAAAVDAFNASSQYSATLSVSVGSARFEDGRDHAFKDVFSRADQAMYRRKKEAHAARP
jgi:diguanylate cyclase (GGDEF)-like protein